jgi:hypothetical protein
MPVAEVDITGATNERLMCEAGIVARLESLAKSRFRVNPVRASERSEI